MTTEIKFVSVSSRHTGGTKFYRVSRIDGPNGSVVIANWGPFKGHYPYPAGSAASRFKVNAVASTNAAKGTFVGIISEKISRGYKTWSKEEVNIHQWEDRDSAINFLLPWLDRNEAVEVVNRIAHPEDVEKAQRFAPKETVSAGNLADVEWGSW